MSTGGRPRAPSSSGAPLIERIICSATSSPNGQRRNTTSFITSTKMPPSPNIAIGPNTGSRWMPRMHSTPPCSCFATSTPSMRAVGAACLARASSRRSRRAPRRHRRRSAARRRSPTCAGCPATGSSSPPGSRTAPPRRRPPRRLSHGCSGADGDAGCGQQPLGLGLARRRGGQRHRRHAAAAAPALSAANAAPKRPIAAIAVTARVGSSCTTQPSASSSARRSGGVITDNA